MRCAASRREAIQGIILFFSAPRVRAGRCLAIHPDAAHCRAAHGIAGRCSPIQGITFFFHRAAVHGISGLRGAGRGVARLANPRSPRRDRQDRSEQDWLRELMFSWLKRLLRRKPRGLPFEVQDFSMPFPNLVGNPISFCDPQDFGMRFPPERPPTGEYDERGTALP